MNEEQGQELKMTGQLEIGVDEYGIPELWHNGRRIVKLQKREDGNFTFPILKNKEMTKAYDIQLIGHSFDEVFKIRLSCEKIEKIESCEIIDDIIVEFFCPKCDNVVEGKFTISNMEVMCEDCDRCFKVNKLKEGRTIVKEVE